MALCARIDRVEGAKSSTSTSAKSRNVLLAIVAKNGWLRWDTERLPAAFELNKRRVPVSSIEILFSSTFFKEDFFNYYALTLIDERYLDC